MGYNISLRSSNCLSINAFDISLLIYIRVKLLEKYWNNYSLTRSNIELGNKKPDSPTKCQCNLFKRIKKV